MTLTLGELQSGSISHMFALKVWKMHFGLSLCFDPRNTKASWRCFIFERQKEINRSLPRIDSYSFEAWFDKSYFIVTKMAQLLMWWMHAANIALVLSSSASDPFLVHSISVADESCHKHEEIYLNYSKWSMIKVLLFLAPLRSSGSSSVCPSVSVWCVCLWLLLILL